MGHAQPGQHLQLVHLVAMRVLDVLGIRSRQVDQLMKDLVGQVQLDVQGVNQESSCGMSKRGGLQISCP